MSKGASKTYGLANLACCPNHLNDQTGPLWSLSACCESPFSTTSPEHPDAPPHPMRIRGVLRSHLTQEPLSCPRALATEPAQTPNLTLSLPEGPHRAVQEEASTRAREAGARLGRGRARTGPGGAAGARSGSGSPARPAPPAPARAGHVVPRPPALWAPAASGPRQPAWPQQGPRTLRGERRGPKGRAPGGGAPRRGRREGRTRGAPGACFRGSRPAGSVRVSGEQRVAPQALSRGRSGREQRTAEAPGRRPLRETVGGRSVCLHNPLLGPAGDPGAAAGLGPASASRSSLTAENEYPVRAWRCTALKTAAGTRVAL
ncbi:uncharacterized protein LOC144615068 [Panthera onca]